MNDERAALAPAARLLGRLLVREVDAATAAELAQPELAAALAELGITPPAVSDLDTLATQYFTRFVNPTAGAPPVQSLWLHGQYDGDAARAVRGVAVAAGLELASGARGAPPDHIGCILHLWGEVVGTRPELAARLERDHVGWSARALAAAAADRGFYGAVARAAQTFVGVLRAGSEPA